MEIPAHGQLAAQTLAGNPGNSDTIRDGPAVDGEVLSWLSVPVEGLESSADATGEACPQCGYCGPMELDPEGHTLNCPACRREVEATDDDVLSWLSMSDKDMESPARATEVSCPQCGYCGPMELDPTGLAMNCPACRREFHLGFHANLQVHCPDCGYLIDIAQEDRGRTVICPGCHSFLGCLVDRERRSPWRWWRRG
jgi:hypothetical protein